MNNCKGGIVGNFVRIRRFSIFTHLSEYSKIMIHASHIYLLKYMHANTQGDLKMNYCMKRDKTIT